MNDALVEHYVAKALDLASKDTSDLLSQLDEADSIVVGWREANEGALCHEIELAAARQYFFCRCAVARNGPAASVPVTAFLWGYTTIKAILELFNMSSILAIGTCPEPSKASTGDISWGMSGLADGLSDWATPRGP
jgi:hypothetical protein